jgi:hypothetical protein
MLIGLITTFAIPRAWDYLDIPFPLTFSSAKVRQVRTVDQVVRAFYFKIDISCSFI